jgi:hypothetical protein
MALTSRYSEKQEHQCDDCKTREVVERTASNVSLPLLPANWIRVRIATTNESDTAITETSFELCEECKKGEPWRTLRGRAAARIEIENDLSGLPPINPNSPEALERQRRGVPR